MLLSKTQNDSDSSQIFGSFEESFLNVGLPCDILNRSECHNFTHIFILFPF